MGRRSLNSFFVLSLVSLSTTTAVWQETRNCLTYCADHITCCEKISPQPNSEREDSTFPPPLIYASEGRYGKRSNEEEKKNNPIGFDPQQNNGADDVPEIARPKRSMDEESGKENEQFYRYFKVGKRSIPHVTGFDRSKDADMMMRLGKRSVVDSANNFNKLLELKKRQTASMMRMGKRSTAPDADVDDPDTTAESANRIYRMLLNKRQTASMMRMGKRSGRSAFSGDMMRMGKRNPAFSDDYARFGKREYSSFNGDMMRMGKRDLAFNDDLRFGKREYSSFNGDMMRMGKRNSAFSDDLRFGKRGYSSAFNGDMMRMGKRNLAFNDDLRFGKRDLSSFNGDMMRMGKRYLTYNDEPRFGKRDIEMTRSGRDPWIIMDDEFDSLHKRVDNGQMWKKNLDQDLMRIGKKSAFNDDMMRMGKRDWMDKRFTLMSDNMRYGK